MKPLVLRTAAGAAVFALILLAAYAFDWSNRLEAIEESRARIEKLKAEYVAKKRVAVSLPLYRERLKLAETAFVSTLSVLPPRTEPQVFKLLSAATGSAGLSVEDMRPADQELQRDFYAELPVSLRASGRYHDFGRFAAEVAGLPRLVALGDFSIGPGAKDGRLPISATVKVFRYLDDEEVAARRKAERAARKGKKG